MTKKTIAVDLDGVVHKYSKGFQDGSMYDEPIDGAKEALERIVEAGFEVVLFTTRLNPMFGDPAPMRKRVEDWLSKNGFEKGKHYHDLTNNKPPAVVYIDDRAIRFVDWSNTLSQLQLDSNP